MENRQLLELESVSGPTIIIDAKDVVTFQGSKYAAEHFQMQRSSYTRQAGIRL